MAQNFKSYSQYYDLLYQTKNYILEADYINNLLKELLPTATNLIELGCGTGNHAEHLCNAGYSITGLEQSSDMVNIAFKKDIKGFRPIIKDIIAFDLPEQFDAAISLFHVISYLTENDQLLSCFNSVIKHLKPGGIFIFDTWYSPAVYFQKPDTRIKRLQNNEISVTRIAEPVLHINRNIVDVNYEIIIKNKSSLNIEVFNETHPMRHFSIPEIELAAQLSGFKLLLTEEFLTRNAPGTDTWGVCFILKKND